MKVILANNYFYMRGGAERVMFNDLDALSTRGVEVVPFSAVDPANLPSDHSDEFAEGVDVHATSASGRLRAAREAIHCARTAKAFARLLDKERPDIVHFHNIYGRLTTSIPPASLTPLMLALRTARAALLVPVIEELFWRGWLPRWIQSSRFARIPLGQYTPLAFWATAVLFAAEHGPFWEVGLVTGIIYNWWMRRTRSLGDLMLVHAVTNLSLSLFVIQTRNWQFWM